MDTRSKPRKTVTELLQEDTAFKKVTSPALSSTEDASMLVSKNNTSMYSSVSSHTSGKAAPQSMTMRREHVEEELTVRKAIVMKKKDDLAKAVLHDDDDDDDDSIDEIEDIPILDTTMMTAAPKDRADDDDDPEIVMEKAPCDEKPDDRHILDNSGNAPITTSKAALTDALYQEMKQLETLGQATAPSPSVEDNDDDMDDMDDMDDGDAKPHRHHVEAAAGSIDDVKLPDGEPKKRSKKPKQHAEDKKKAFELFNPKRVPYVPNQLLEFVVNPLEVGRGHVVRCFIERNRSGQNKLSPLYTMLIEINSSKGRPILYARKKPTSRISSHFIFSLNKEDLFLSRSLRSKQFVGKLRSDTRKMEYTLFDQGDNPEDIDSDCEIDEEVRQHIRAQMAVIRYHPMKKEFPRKMEVILPAIVEHETADEPIKSYLDWRPISRDQSFEALFTEVAEQGGQNVLERDKFICMHKRESQYDPLSSCIVDFRSRATSVSVKNFQLVHSQPTDQDKYRQAMSTTADELKEQGNAAFEAKRFDEAEALYSKAILQDAKQHVRSLDGLIEDGINLEDRPCQVHEALHQPRQAQHAYELAVKHGGKKRDVVEKVAATKKAADKEDRERTIHSREDWNDIYHNISDKKLRLAILVKFWNASTKAERFSFFMRFLTILSNGGTRKSLSPHRHVHALRVASRIGRYSIEQMEPIPAANYEPIELPVTWTSYFNALALAKKSDVMEDMYDAATEAEKTTIINDMKYYIHQMYKVDDDDIADE
ncbi:hypothetical protein DYB30_001987 [Aphanomyces astaci]|uniref:Tubby C-terminal domain-containing protein n=1 Tax=Aphanomyces astaci TaxID=112090 RepID=A0A397D960_APHAT|nr:hypothetical protein DYB36_002134 [Aphanomyces astaci]RHY50953.1 hypothetical protein DYB34_001543 [Aphanomyces astaci]RHY61104.1 hypothetical protein DYB30_001987 [Aphanomyces astaci]